MRRLALVLFLLLPLAGCVRYGGADTHEVDGHTVTCPHCGSSATCHAWFDMNEGGVLCRLWGTQKYRCDGCGRQFEF